MRKLLRDIFLAASFDSIFIISEKFTFQARYKIIALKFRKTVIMFREALLARTYFETKLKSPPPH